MELIFYCADSNDFSSGLLDQVRDLVPVERLVMCRNFVELQASLLKPEYDLFAAILVVSSRHDLLDLVSIGEFLRSIRVILILHDREQETVSKGHDLKPRFLTWPDWNSREVIAVLGKMLENVEQFQKDVEQGQFSHRRNQRYGKEEGIGGWDRQRRG